MTAFKLAFLAVAGGTLGFYLAKGAWDFVMVALHKLLTARK